MRALTLLLFLLLLIFVMILSFPLEALSFLRHAFAYKTSSSLLLLSFMRYFFIKNSVFGAVRAHWSTCRFSP